MKKRLLSLVLALCMAVSIMPSFMITADAAEIIKSGECGDNLSYVLDDEGTLTISGTGAMWNWESDWWVSTAPWSSESDSIAKVIIDNGVTNIGEYAFYGCTNLQSAVLSDSVTSIGGCAFLDCSSLESVNFPAKLKEIYFSAFASCIGLKSVTLPDSVKILDNCAFQGCTGMERIKLSNGITKINEGVLAGCTSLESVEIPDSVKVIGRNSFQDSTGLKSIEIPNGVITIGSSAFEWCTGLNEITIPDSVVSIGQRAFEGTAYYDDKANWEGGVLYIDNHLIRAENDAVESYEIKPGTKTIAGNAFFCENLKDIVIPDGVVGIGEYAFEVTAYYDDEANWENDVLYIGKHLVRAKESLAGTYEIKPRTKCVADGAFWGCEDLENINIPRSVIYLGEHAFARCSNLSDVNIPQNVVMIGRGMFAGCSALSDIVIPDSVVYIESEAFSDCTGLESIVFPKHVTVVESWTFAGSDSLTDVYYTGTEEEWNNIVIKEENEPLLNATIHYNYKRPPVWTTATDAGYYSENGKKLGLMRYLFHADINGEVTESGIKFIKSETDDTQVGNIIKGIPSKTFYGDLINIPENTTGTYFAKGFVVVDGIMYWSAPLGCMPDFTKEFKK